MKYKKFIAIVISAAMMLSSMTAVIHAEEAEQMQTSAETLSAGSNRTIYSEGACSKVLSVGNNRTFILMADGRLRLEDTYNDLFTDIYDNVADIALAGYGQTYLLVLTKAGNVYEMVASTDVSLQEKLMIGNIIAISAGGQRLALTKSGKVYGWGINDFGQAGEGRPIMDEGILIGFEGFHEPRIVNTLYNEELTDIKKIYAGSDGSYALANNGDLYYWGNSFGFTPDFNDVYARVISSNVKDIAEGYGAHLVLYNDGQTKVYYKLKTELTNSNLTNIAKLQANFIIKNDGTIWYWNVVDDGNTEPVLECVQMRSIPDVYSITGNKDSGLAILKDGAIVRWTSENGPLEYVREAAIPEEGHVIVEEVYNTSGNAAYHADQEKLETMGWSEGYYYGKGDFTAKSGKLIVRKTSPQIADSSELIYDVTKTFTQRTDNWNNDSRVSVWTNHFKGDYSVEVKGSFHPQAGQVYYDILGAKSNGAPATVARYKIDPFTTGAIHVYNCMLNGAGTVNYTLWKNAAVNRVIRTTLHSRTSSFQAFENNAVFPSQTTVDGAFPSDTFSMTDWEKRDPGEYITGFKISAQDREPAGSTIASLDYVKLIEHSKIEDVVDDAISGLSMADITDTPGAVVSNLKNLPTSKSGANITWTSSNPQLLSNEGILQNDRGSDEDVIMTAKITNPSDGFTKYMEFRLTVPDTSGFEETYSGNYAGNPSSADGEGTTSFAQLPMWKFSYPGISNGTNGESHFGQVLVKDGYLTFKKISDRQTANYQECVTGIRSLSNVGWTTRLESADIGITAKVYDTGTMRFAPITVDSDEACILILDASTKRIQIVYGETVNGSIQRATQTINTVDPTVDHDYLLEIKNDKTFVFYIDGQPVFKPDNTAERQLLPDAANSPVLSHLKTWITNVTYANKEVGKLKKLSVRHAVDA